MTLPTDFAGLTTWFVANSMVPSGSGDVIGMDWNNWESLTPGPGAQVAWAASGGSTLDGNGVRAHLSALDNTYSNTQYGAHFEQCVLGRQAAARFNLAGSDPNHNEGLLLENNFNLDPNNQTYPQSIAWIPFTGGSIHNVGLVSNTAFTIYIVFYAQQLEWRGDYTGNSSADTAYTQRGIIIGNTGTSAIYTTAGGGGNRIGIEFFDQTRFPFSSGVDIAHIDVPVSLNTWIVAEAMLSGSTISIRTSEGQSANIACQTGKSSGQVQLTHIGANLSGHLTAPTQAFQGYIPEFATYNVALSQANRDALMTYFGTSRGCIGSPAQNVTANPLAVPILTPPGSIATTLDVSAGPLAVPVVLPAGSITIGAPPPTGHPRTQWIVLGDKERAPAMVQSTRR